MAPIQKSGVMLFTPGRACAGPLAVVLHEYRSGIEQLDNQMLQCPRPRPVQSPGCHTSFHYGIGGNCHFHQYIANADTAWGFGVTPPTCPEPICPPDECASCTGFTVGQYNPDNDGNPPVLPPFVLGPDGTVNCGVLHVAVTNLFPVNALLGDGSCCAPNPQAYNCLVESLCYIFDITGLVPSQTTLLVHCGEQICLDIDQLILDIIECLATPPPPAIPCNCVPTEAQLCASLDELELGSPAVYGTTVVLGNDCEFHLLPVIPVDNITVNALDTNSINTTVVEDPANTFTVSSDVIISPNAGNQATILGNGLFVSSPDNFTVITTNDSDLVIDPALADLFVYVGGAPVSQNILTPLPGGRTSIYIKNQSADILSLTASAVNGIDSGVAAIALDPIIVAGYPFGNNGGEAVHLIYVDSLQTWVVI